jgi:hypothetical protein
MSKNTKQTSQGVGSLAARTLHDPSASQKARSLAASALSQSGTGKQTGAAMEDVAARVLQSPKYASDTKTLAASVLSQANKGR